MDWITYHVDIDGIWFDIAEYIKTTADTRGVVHIEGYIREDNPERFILTRLTYKPAVNDPKHGLLKRALRPLKKYFPLYVAASETFDRQGLLKTLHLNAIVRLDGSHTPDEFTSLKDTRPRQRDWPEPRKFLRNPPLPDQIDGDIALPGVQHVDLVGERGKFVSIYSWTGDGTGTRHALQILKEYAPHVVVHDPGEPGTQSRGYWDKMFAEGLITEMIDDEDNIIARQVSDSYERQEIP
jgi:hypothetical protein